MDNLEAHIVCEVREYILKDLNLVLLGGQEAYVDAKKAKASRDLSHAVGIGALKVAYVKRCHVKKPPVPAPFPPPPPYVRRLSQYVNPPAPQALPRASFPSLDEELDKRFARFEGILEDRLFDLSQGIQRALLKELQESLPALMPDEARLVARLEKSLAPLLEASVNKAFEAHKGKFSVAVQETSTTADDTPMFIPSDLTSSEGNIAHINVQATSTQQGGLDSAAAALKAMKKKKPRRRKTKSKD